MEDSREDSREDNRASPSRPAVGWTGSGEDSYARKNVYEAVFNGERVLVQEKFELTVVADTLSCGVSIEWRDLVERVMVLKRGRSA
jgi:hypothetical protein